MQNEYPTTSDPTRATPPPEPAPRDRNGRRRDLPYKVPFLAGFLSGILPGLGQVYVGYYQAGIVLGAVFAGVITLLSSGDLDGLEPFFGIMLGFTWIYGIIDAARRAQAVNLALDGHGDEPLPQNLTLPTVGGSRTGGVILVVVGSLLVLYTGFDVELAWVEDWWPLALIGLGGWLIYKSRREERGGNAASDRSAGGPGPGGPTDPRGPGV
jgi:hypothetical protein